MTRALRLACIDSAAMPLFGLTPDGGATRPGYEPDVAAAIAAELGRPLEWAIMPWDDMIPSVERGDVDGILCGQGIIPERQARVDFTRPYAIFNETVLVRADDPATGPDDFAGRRVGAIAESTNMKLAETFPGAVLVPFGNSDDVFRDMIEAVRSGAVDAMIDDDVATLPVADDPDFRAAFTAPTGNRWGVSIRKGDAETMAAIDGALERIIADGRLETTWTTWMAHFPFPEALRDGRPS